MDLFLIRSKLNLLNIFRWPVILAVIVGIIVLGYVGTRIWKPELLQKLPATIFGPTAEKKPAEEKLPEALVREVSRTQAAEEGKYTEKAEKGEGITHLARKALKKYLQEQDQPFKVTPEHKVFVEDYMAKKLGGRWLKLGETLEFSENLLKEALAKAEKLTPEQLTNLTQYSQLVPALNY